MDVKHIGIITGGFNAQVDVNVDHAKDIGSALESDYTITYYNLASTRNLNRLIEDKRLNQLDIVFNNAAGKKGGDGTVEGFLELLNVPYVGSDTLATAVAFDKKSTKAVVADAGIPIVRGFNIPQADYLDNKEDVIRRCEEIGYPLVVKASQGSDSIGISLVKKAEQLVPALELAFEQDDNVLIEDFIRRQAEITCMVIGNGNNVEALQPVERVYDTEMLYEKDVTDRTYRIPPCSPAVVEKIKEYSKIAHQTVGCADYSRSDFLVNKKDQIFFLELNGHAGLGKQGPTAFTAKVAKEWDYPEMIREILKLAVDRHSI
jgi:D-alanine-D-alanine ligase